MTMITPSYLGETIEYSSLHACRSTLEDPTAEIMDCSIGNSKSQLHKARMRLRELLHESMRDKAREDRKAAGNAGGKD